MTDFEWLMEKTSSRFVVIIISYTCTIQWDAVEAYVTRASNQLFTTFCVRSSLAVPYDVLCIVLTWKLEH